MSAPDSPLAMSLSRPPLSLSLLWTAEQDVVASEAFYGVVAAEAAESVLTGVPVMRLLPVVAPLLSHRGLGCQSGLMSFAASVSRAPGPCRPSSSRRCCGWFSGSDRDEFVPPETMRAEPKIW